MKVYIHLVFCTKYRYGYFNVENISQLRVLFQTDYLKNTFEIVEAGGHKNHIHLLIRMEKTESLPSIIHAIKGPTSRWINKHGLCKKTFRWAEGYYAARVPEEALPRVIKYIQNQEEHHSRQHRAATRGLRVTRGLNPGMPTPGCLCKPSKNIV